MTYDVRRQAVEHDSLRGGRREMSDSTRILLLVGAAIGSWLFVGAFILFGITS